MKNSISMSRRAPDRQRAKLRLRAGKRASLTMVVDFSNVGLLSVGVLVSSKLLSTAILVRASAARSDTRSNVD
ncbi:hypothetical protein [Sphingomonas prati]|uniref:hypothetical protein n=1 Tax=Sphingomonas prati TaxID=1843237 RepID=UPI00160DD933|nr:hypothetical protein [Sphingomonas prati]